MGETTSTPANVMWDLIRSIFSVFDLIAFWTLNCAYQIFFNVASAELFSNETIMKFYGRIQLIIGVFMMFQLALTILKGIMDPDSFTNSKTGAGNIIMRVATALVLLTIMVPINISNPKNEYEKQLNNNGLLFGTLYSLQNRILSNNTLGRLILGTNDTSYYSANSSDLKTLSRVFSSTILKGFYRINLKPEDERPRHEDGKDDSVFNENRMCTNISSSTLDAYTRFDADYSEIIGMINYTCEVDDESKTSFQKAMSLVNSKLSGNNMYVFTFMPIISAVVGFIFAVLLISFSVDVAVRAVKLVVLRLIAPIPIIMYMDPKGSKDSSFNTWVKTLTSTYLDLFIRLASVYFVIFLIQDMMLNGVVMDVGGSGLITVLTYIIIWIGLFVFAKQAPKFIKQVLGVKDDGGKLFGGLNEVLSLGAVAGGAVGSAATGYRAAKAENDTLHEGSALNPLRNIGSGILSGISGGYAGVKAFTGKDATPSSVMQAQNQVNARRASHSTGFGRLQSQAYGMFTGRGLSEKGNAELKANQDAFKAFKDYKTTLEDEALKKTNLYGKDKSGSGNLYNYQKLLVAVERARNSGQATFDYSDGVHTYTGLRTDAFDINTMNDIKGSQAESFAQSLMSAVNSPSDPANAQFLNDNGTAYNSYLKAKKASGDLKTTSFDGTYGNTKKSMGETSKASTQFETDMKQIMRRANDQAKK